MDCSSLKASQQVQGPLSTPPCHAASARPLKYLQVTCDISDVWATSVNAYIKYL